MAQRLHVRAGISHELEWCDVAEVLLQVAVYAGVPAANTGFHISAELKRDSNSRLASGAASLPPWPPCSTNTTTTIDGVCPGSPGAYAANQA